MAMVEDGDYLKDSPDVIGLGVEWHPTKWYWAWFLLRAIGAVSGIAYLLLS